MPRHEFLVRVRDIALRLVLGVMLADSAPEICHASGLRRTAEVAAIEQARPSVVNIHGRKTIASELPDQTKGDGVQQVNGMGTGIIVDERGYIVTNYHVVEGVNKIQVTLASGKTLLADLVAHDGKTDLAVIKITADDPLPVINLGTSRDLMTGEPVLAIGNAYGYTHTVTRGIISALHRPIEVSESQTYPDLIQTDASINPGNSGGPLLNIDGEMIGINVAVRMGAQGIGFALPVDEALEVVARLVNEEVSRRVEHGVVGQTTRNAERSTFVVTNVQSGAAASGLRPGDVIKAADGKPVLRSLDFERFMLGHKAGEELPMLVVRGGEELKMSLMLGEAVVPEASVSDLAWDILGVHLAPAPAQTIRQQSSRYNGGLKITGVRPGGPASKQGIRTGDILVGLHKWETVSMDNVSYILDNDEFVQAQPAKFYILRGGETLYGQIRVSLRDE